MKIDSVSNQTGAYSAINGSSGLSYTKNISGGGNAAHMENSASRIGSLESGTPTNKTSSTASLTNAERAYFAKLFPDAISQINSHKTYSPSGMNPSVDLGQIINRKV